jgi:hypothetical protein
MATQVKASKKNSPKVVVGKNANNKPAESYDKRGTGKASIDSDSAYETGAAVLNKMNPSVAGISKGNTAPVETSGVKIRGTGAATKGVMSRGPLA